MGGPFGLGGFVDLGVHGALIALVSTSRRDVPCCREFKKLPSFS